MTSARNRTGLGILVVSLLLGACATTPGSMAQAERDPFEKTNRRIYAFNKGVDTAVIKPVTKGYRAVVPMAARRGASNALDNIDEPWTMVNSVLQGKVGNAFKALDRFLINTVLGVGGLADHATDMGIPRNEEDFGQTLAVWGLNSGPYIVLPLLGPSTIRDGVGFGVDTVADPLSILINNELTNSQQWGMTGFEVIDLRSRLIDTADVLLQGSADEYATIRAAYLLQRQSLIYDGDPPEDEDLPPAPGQAAADTDQATKTPDTNVQPQEPRQQ